MKHETKLVGNWHIVCHGPNGKIKDERRGQNVICTNGKEFLASFLNSATTAASTFTMRYIAIGEDATGEAAADTALGIEVDRRTGTATYTSGALFSVVATFPTGYAASVTEYGLFSTAPTATGTIFSRDTESVINKGTDDILTVTTEVTIV